MLQTHEEIDEFYWLKHQDDRNPQNRFAVQLGHRNKGKPENGINGEYVAFVESGIDKPEAEQQEQPPGEPSAEIIAFAGLVVGLDKEREPEEQCKNGVRFTSEKEKQRIPDYLVETDQPLRLSYGSEIKIEMFDVVQQHDGNNGKAS
jgi:hypothetical protein